MSNTGICKKVAQLKSQVTILEQLLDGHEQAVLKQSDKLEQALEALQKAHDELKLQVGAGEFTKVGSARPEQTTGRQQIAEEGDLLRTLIDNMPDFIFVKDTGGRFVINNMAHMRVLRATTQGELAGKTDFDIFPQELAAQYYADEQAVIQSGQPLVGREEPYIDEAGNRRWLSTTKTPLRDRQGKIVGLVGLSRDITERKRTEEALGESKERFRQVITSISHHVYMTEFTKEGDRINHYLSPNIETLTGYPQEKFLADWSFWPSTLIHPEDRAAAAAQVERFSKGQDSEVEYRLIRAGGDIIWVRDSVRVEKDAARQSFLVYGVVSDITERKQAEAAEELHREALAKRAAELETVAQVSTAVSTVLEVDKLLQHVVDLTKTSFGLYHAHIFLLNETDNTLDLAAGAGKVGRQMVAEGWSIPLRQKQSLVARAARTRQGVIVNDVSEDPYFFPNPLLPHTRSELAVPLLVSNRVLGVLDVQADVINRFTQEDVRIQTTLAGQLASAIRNARLFARVTRAQAEAENLLQETLALHQLSHALAGTLQASEVLDIFFQACINVIGFEYVQYSLVDKRQNRVKAMAGVGLPDSQIERPNRSLDSDDIIVDIIKTGQTEIISGWDDRFDRETFEAEGHADWVRVFTPIMLRQENIGLVEAGFNKKKQANIEDSQLRLLRAFIDQTALAFDNARRYEASQTAAHRLALLSEMGAELNQTTSVDELFKIVAAKVNLILGGDRASVALLNPAGDSFDVLALDGLKGAIPAGAQLPVAGTMIGQALQENRLLIMPDVRVSDFSEHRQLARQGLRSIMTTPLVAGGQALGTLNVGSRESYAYTARDEGLMLQAASLVASIIESRRLFEQTQQAKSLLDKRVKELACLNDIGREMVESPPIADFLQWVTERIPAVMQFPGVCVAAIEFEDQLYGLTEAVRQPCQMVHSLRIDDEVVGRVYIAYTEEHDFLDEESALLGDIARRVNGYVENQHLFDQMAAVLAETRALYEVSRALTTAASLDEVLGSILTTLNQHGIAIGADNITLTTVDMDEAGQPEWTETLAWWFCDDREPPYPVGTRFPLKDMSITKLWIADPSSPLLFGDIRTDARLDEVDRDRYLQAGALASVLLPLSMAGRWVGLLSIGWPEVQEFTGRDKRLYRAFMGQFATLIESQRLFDQTEAARAETEEQVRRLAQLNEMSRQLNLAESEDEVFKVAVGQMDQIIHTDRTSIALLTAEGDSFEVLVLQGEPGVIPVGAQVPVEGTALGTVVQENRVLVTPDTRASHWPNARKLAKRGLFSTMSAPLVIGGQAIGTLNIGSKNLNAYSPRDESLILQVTSLLAAIIESRRLFEQTQHILAETERLYQASRNLTSANDLQEIVAAVAEGAPVKVINRAVLHLFEYDSAGELEASVVAANWHSGQGTPPTAPGTRFPRASFAAIELFSSVEPVFFDDVRHDERIDPATGELLQQLNVRAMVVLPLWVGPRQVGGLLLQAEERHHFNVNEMRSYLSLVGQMAIVVENKRLLEQTQARARREQILREVTDRVRGSVDVNTIMRTAAQEVGQVLGRPAFVCLGNKGHRNDRDRRQTPIAEEDP